MNAAGQTSGHSWPWGGVNLSAEDVDNIPEADTKSKNLWRTMIVVEGSHPSSQTIPSASIIWRTRTTGPRHTGKFIADWIPTIREITTRIWSCSPCCWRIMRLATSARPKMKFWELFSSTRHRQHEFWERLRFHVLSVVHRAQVIKFGNISGMTRASGWAPEDHKNWPAKCHPQHCHNELLECQKMKMFKSVK